MGLLAGGFSGASRTHIRNYVVRKLNKHDVAYYNLHINRLERQIEVAKSELASGKIDQKRFEWIRDEFYGSDIRGFRKILESGQHSTCTQKANNIKKIVLGEIAICIA
jgi:hypothetical protein